MSNYTPHAKEEERLAALDSYQILDSLPEKDYNDLVRLASYVCDAPISMVNLVAAERQWSKAVHGTDLTEIDRKDAFCPIAINSEDEIFIVHDTHLDERFKENPLVIKDPNLGFYAGVKLETEEGLPLGMFCVLDYEPRDLSDKQKDALRIIGKQVMNLLNLRRNNLSLERARKELENRNDELERFASLAAHDLKSPLGQVTGLLHLFKDSYGADLDKEALEILDTVDLAANNLKELIDGLLDYARSDQMLESKREWVAIEELKEDISKPFNLSNKGRIELISPLEEIYINKTAIQRILINLVSNAIKYNDKKSPLVEVSLKKDDHSYQISVEDNGPGIAPEDRESIFQMFQILDNEDNEGNTGHGIGLAMVKKLTESMGGSIEVEDSQLGGVAFHLQVSASR